MTTQTACHVCGHELPAAQDEAPLAQLDRAHVAAISKAAALEKLKVIYRAHGDTPELRQLIDDLGLSPADLKLPPARGSGYNSDEPNLKKARRLYLGSRR